MSDMLPQDEIDRLVAATPRGQVPAGEQGAPALQRKIKRYDFKRPDKFSKDQLRTVSIMHETFARLACTALSAQLRTLSHVRLASVDQLTYEEFIRSIPNPTTIAIVNMDPLKGCAVLEIDPAISFAIIDRGFGGQGEDAKLTRELSDLEKTVMRGVVIRLVDSLRDSWTTVIDLQLRLADIETNPQFAQIVPPPEMVVLVTLETRIGEIAGMINFCIPYITIEPILPKLSPQYVYFMARRTAPSLRASTTGLAASAEVFYEAEQLSLDDLLHLKQGSLVRVPDYGAGKAFLRVGGVPLLPLVAGRAGYAIEAGGKELLAPRSTPGTAGSAEVAGVLRDALRSFSQGIDASLKAIDARIGELARKQEELSEQLIFESPEKEVPSGGARAETSRPFSTFVVEDCEPLAAVLAVEHPQAIALVLSHLQSGLAACILARIPEGMQPDVVARIGMLDRVAPEVLSQVDRFLREKIGAMGTRNLQRTGGVDAVTEILNVSTRAIEKRVVDSLEQRLPGLAEEIKKRMFVFEDIVMLDREAVARVLKEVPEDDLVLALKATEEKVSGFVRECMPRPEAEKLQARLEKTGRVRLSDVDAAQQRIVSVIRRMEEQGRIVVGRVGEVVD